ncbi:hypothetical protein C2857_002642 [Epichloe festucae Fl1]|uniref:Uncharacterized protein n=1 Tax=Epichloe festucae (strain Fl1) TaxID=877507 RepID=A0A7U3Q215_EPIFF|nr:hypothetical protein C2857_002642 [Epichloe festucae Fl1]
MEMLNEERQLRSDTNNLGSINNYSVVIAGLPKAGELLRSHRSCLAEDGMPKPEVLPVGWDWWQHTVGHVVVSEPTGIHSGAVQYDHGKARAGEFQRRGSLAPPPTALCGRRYREPLGGQFAT